MEFLTNVRNKMGHAWTYAVVSVTVLAVLIYMSTLLPDNQYPYRPLKHASTLKIKQSIADIDNFLSSWKNGSVDRASFAPEQVVYASKVLMEEYKLLVAANNIMRKEVTDFRLEGEQCLSENDDHMKTIQKLSKELEYMQARVDAYEMERTRQDNMNRKQLDRMKQIQELVKTEKKRLHDEGVFAPLPDPLKKQEETIQSKRSTSNIPIWKTYNESTYRPFEPIDYSLSKKCDDGVILPTNPCLDESKDPGEENMEGEEKYLLYQPMGRFNNQRGALRNAIYLAKALNRILVIPKVSSNGICIYCNETLWHPADKYFDLDRIRKYVPIISIEAFRGLVQGIIPRMVVLYSDKSSADRAQRETPWYFEREGFNVSDSSTIMCNWKYVSLNRVRCMLAPYRDDKIVALNLLFFKIKVPKEDVVELAGLVSYNSQMQNMAVKLINIPEDRKYLALHIRRGDFEEYCIRRHGDNLQHCYPSAQKILYSVNMVLKQPEFHGDSLVDRYAEEPPVIFVSTDSQDIVMKMFANSGFVLRMIDAEMVDQRIGNDPALFDDNVVGIMDQIGCIQSTYFIGNMFSSFSKVVIESRMFEGYTTW